MNTLAEVRPPAVVVLSSNGLPVARSIAAASGGEVHGLVKRVPDPDVSFEETGRHLRALFAEGRAIIAVMASGALVRLIAPLLADKRSEPPILCVAEDGSSVVPLLGGHHGANDLARTLAAVLGGHAAITTAGDLAFGIALDAPPQGYALENPEAAKPIMARLLAGEGAKYDRTVPWLSEARLPHDETASIQLTVSLDRRAPGPDELLYRPKSLVLGIGSERGAPAEDAITLARDVLEEADVSPLGLAAVVSVDLKADEVAVHAVADHFGVPARFYPAPVLEAERDRLVHPSEIVFAEIGCHGVAEGAALASVGRSGYLRVAKRKSARVTAALAQAITSLDPATLGRSRGTLFVVGIGPGSADWRSPEVTGMIARSTDLVGYSLYLDILGSLANGKTRHAFDLGAEEARVRHAVQLAGEGRTVALVCSGDAGIYAMATLVFELLHKGDLPDAARRIAVACSPGISALQAAAARAGAPLGHDFCTISLSDLLTPWDDIQRRVKAAAEGDFVIAFYNPVSRKRRTQLAFAREELLRHRPAETPVILATNLGRPGEQVRVVPLRDLRVDDVDMLTVVLVGSSNSRAFRTGDGREWVYTPRGYAGKEGTRIGAQEARAER